MKNAIYTILILLLLTNCKEKKTEKVNKANSIAPSTTIVALEDSDTADFFPENVYKRFEGIIAEKQVVVHLQSDQKNIFGVYFYPDGSLIHLHSKERDPKTKQIILEEFSLEKEKTDQWFVALKKDSLTGMWQKGDGSKTYSIQLKSSYPNGSYHLEEQVYAGGKSNWLDLPIVKAVNDKESDWINKVILNNISVKTNLSFEKGMEQYFKRETGSFKAAYRDKKSDDNYDTLYSLMQQYEAGIYFVSYHVLYNQDGYIQLEILTDEQSGGIHPNHYLTNICLDVFSKKQLRLNDIITLDTLSLGKMLTEIGNKENDLNKEFITPSKNFNFTKEGISFNYEPYALASYAAGIVSINIPYFKIKNYLQPDFKARMNL